MGTNAPGASDGNDGSDGNMVSASSPLCTRCAGSDTEPVATMRRHTVDADNWYRCDGCGHVFTTPRDDA
jgi:hypothetical protein